MTAIGECLRETQHTWQRGHPGHARNVPTTVCARGVGSVRPASSRAAGAARLSFADDTQPVQAVPVQRTKRTACTGEAAGRGVGAEQRERVRAERQPSDVCGNESCASDLCDADVHLTGCFRIPFVSADHATPEKENNLIIESEFDQSIRYFFDATSDDSFRRGTLHVPRAAPRRFPFRLSPHSPARSPVVARRRASRRPF